MRGIGAIPLEETLHVRGAYLSQFIPSLYLRHLSPVKNGVVEGAFVHRADIQEIKRRDPIRTESLIDGTTRNEFQGVAWGMSRHLSRTTDVGRKWKLYVFRSAVRPLGVGRTTLGDGAR